MGTSTTIDEDRRTKGADSERTRAGTTGLTDRAKYLVGAVVAGHLLVAVLHGAAHEALRVSLPGWLAATVLVVVLALPVVGFLLLWRGADRLGLVTVTAAMAVSLLLGGTLHFVVESPDNVSQVAAGPWQLPFHATAVALAVTEAAGVGLGLWGWARLGTRTSDGLPDSARLDGVPDNGFRPLTRLTYWFSRREMGEVAEPLAVTAHHPRLLAGYSGFEFALDGADHVDAALRELAELKVAATVGCEYCLDIGSALGREAGLTEAQLRALPDPDGSDAFGETERLVLRYAEAMTRTPTDVPDDLFAALAAEFDEPALVELTAAIAFENYRARFNHAVGMDPQGFSEGAYCPVPERESPPRQASATVD